MCLPPRSGYPSAAIGPADRSQCEPAARQLTPPAEQITFMEYTVALFCLFTAISKLTFCGPHFPRVNIGVMRNNDRNLLDVITDINTNLRHTAEFRKLLCNLDEESAAGSLRSTLSFCTVRLSKQPFPKNLYSLPMACGDNILAHNDKTPVGSWHI